MKVVTPIPWPKVSGMMFTQSYSVPKYKYGVKENKSLSFTQSEELTNPEANPEDNGEAGSVHKREV